MAISIRNEGSKVNSNINVTPMVDVMLVLLIIFMVSAPLLTVGVPIDLPQTQASSLDQADQSRASPSVIIPRRTTPRLRATSTASITVAYEAPWSALRYSTWSSASRRAA